MVNRGYRNTGNLHGSQRKRSLQMNHLFLLLYKRRSFTHSKQTACKDKIKCRNLPSDFNSKKYKNLFRQVRSSRFSYVSHTRNHFEISKRYYNRKYTTPMGINTAYSTTKPNFFCFSGNQQLYLLR